jgi:cupredoxin-like protein
MPRVAQRLIVAVAAGVVFAGSVWAADVLPEIPLTIEKKEFKPADVKVKAGAPFFLVITNKDAAAIEFESKELRVEKVVPSGATVRVRMRALKPGSYPFVDDFHHETTGRIVAE